MTDGASQAAERPRNRVIDALVGGGLALGLITAAHAALPRRAPQPEPRPTLVGALAHVQGPPAQPAPARPARPPVLIAFANPLPGFPIGSPFGLRRLPWEDHARLHAGVDIEAPAGTPIRAAADGVVTRVGVDGGYGRFVELKHAAGLVTRYGHMGAFLPGVRPGGAVKAGWPVGKTGSTGTSTGSHLHFEIRDPKDRPLNPQLFLGHAFARASELPLHKALRTPPTVRVAFVSKVPASKRAAMQAKLAEDAAADASEVGTDARLFARSADAPGEDASARGAVRSRPRGHYGLARHAG